MSFKLTHLKSTFCILTLMASMSTLAETLKVGIFAGKEYEVAEVAAKIAKEKFNLDVELIEFNDGVIPNEALDNGDIDLNAFQHQPYLDEQIQTRGYKLVTVGNSLVYPLAAYSYNIKSLDELKNGSTVTLPNDATNLGRALLLLEKQGLISVDDAAGLNPTLLDVTENPKDLNLIELEAPLLARSLDDDTVGLSVINSNGASIAGLTPAKDGLFMEDKESVYVNIIVAREDNKNDTAVKQFVEAYQTDEVYKKAYEIFDGAVIKGWE
ncbi:methionine ABC transporter substrate-binding lipoprotein MetQ [Thorsellia kenyensis]|uniref:Lipoprotein n=1 Tax=Thorsellia kenyensis TaxID=1549888 RepID=A0ABV6CDG9_9GAMM